MKNFILGLLLSLPLKAAATPYLELKNGRRVQHLNVYFDTAYSFTRLLKSRVVELELKGASGTGYIKGEARGCFIGRDLLPDNHVKVLLNQLELLPVASVTESIYLEVQIQNPNRMSGLVQCEYIAINLED